eukprot:1047675-Pleurochrysis_carterae.AAC.3
MPMGVLHTLRESCSNIQCLIHNNVIPFELGALVMCRCTPSSNVESDLAELARTGLALCELEPLAQRGVLHGLDLEAVGALARVRAVLPKVLQKGMKHGKRDDVADTCEQNKE